MTVPVALADAAPGMMALGVMVTRAEPSRAGAGEGDGGDGVGGDGAGDDGAGGDGDAGRAEPVSAVMAQVGVAAVKVPIAVSLLLTAVIAPVAGGDGANRVAVAVVTTSESAGFGTEPASAGPPQGSPHWN